MDEDGAGKGVGGGWQLLLGGLKAEFAPASVTRVAQE